MKWIKLSLIICLTIVSVMIIKPNTFAMFSDLDVVKTSSLANVEELNGGVKLYQYNTQAYNDGYTNDENRLDNYVVSWFDYGTNENIRIVNANGGGKEGWGGATVSSLARKYEETHPGYIVVGGINADFFMIRTTCEVMNASVSEGEVHKPSIWGTKGTGVIGWTKDGKIVTGKPTFTEKMALEILDDNGNITEQTFIESVNKGVSETGISLLSNNVAKNYDLTGCEIAVVTYTMHRFNELNNANGDKMFVKGQVTEMLNNLTSEDEVKKYTVYLASKDGSLKNFDLLNKNVRLQYQLTGDWQDVVNATGYYAHILRNGVAEFYQSNTTNYSHLVSSLDYINCKKNRTLIGVRPDGSTVLMTVTMDPSKNTYGASYYECAQYLKQIGCIDGYLLDGGGSTSLVIRDKHGSFTSICGNSDGNERRDGNGVLLVCKDPGVDAMLVTNTRFSLTVDVKETGSIFRDDVEVLSIEVDGKNVPYANKPIEFTNLKENTNYTASIHFKMKNDNGSYYYGKMQREFTTLDFDYPDLIIEADQISSDKVLFTHRFVRLNDNIASDVKIKINDQTYAFCNSNTLLVEGLKPNTGYKVQGTAVVTEANTTRQYQVESELLTISTKKDEVPIILNFKLANYETGKTEATFEYEYLYDGTVEEAYIFYIGDEYPLDNKKGTVKVSNIDFSSSESEFILVVKYNGKKLEKNLIIEPFVEKLPEPDPEPAPKKSCFGKSGTTFVQIMNLSVALYFIFRKRK